MRYFYTELVGLTESLYSEHHAHLVYEVSDHPTVTMVIMESKEELSVHKDWDRGPIFQEGTSYRVSWSIRFDDFEEYYQSVRKVSENSEVYYDRPIWVGYWSFLTKDPMGNTIDLYHEPKDAPENSTWIY